MKETMLLFLIILAAVEDVRFGRIPNRLIAAGITVGFIYQLCECGFCGIIYFLWNISVPVILFFLLYLMHALGAGDIKLFSMIGSIVTLNELLKIIETAIILGGFWAFFCLIRGQRRNRIPLSPVIAFSCMLILLERI